MSQQITLKGFVRSKNTGAGIPDLKVELYDYKGTLGAIESAITMNDGDFSLSLSTGYFEPYPIDQLAPFYFKIYRNGFLLFNSKNIVSWNPSEGSDIQPIEVSEDPVKCMISGVVNDMNTGNGLPGKYIMLADKSGMYSQIRTAVSNDDGSFRFDLSENELTDMFPNRNIQLYFRVFANETAQQLLLDTADSQVWIPSTDTPFILKVNTATGGGTPPTQDQELPFSGVVLNGTSGMHLELLHNETGESISGFDLRDDGSFNASFSQLFLRQYFPDDNYRIYFRVISNNVTLLDTHNTKLWTSVDSNPVILALDQDGTDPQIGINGVVINGTGAMQLELRHNDTDALLSTLNLRDDGSFTTSFLQSFLHQYFPDDHYRIYFRVLNGSDAVLDTRNNQLWTSSASNPVVLKLNANTMENTNTNIYGYVRNAATKEGMVGYSVSLMYLLNGSYNEIAGTVTRTDGLYQFILTPEMIGASFPNGSPRFSFQVADDSGLLLDPALSIQWTPDVKGETNLSVDVPQGMLMHLYGTVFNPSGAPAGGVTVRVSQQGFRSQNILGMVVTDSSGNYNIEINSLWMGSVDLSKTGLIVDVLDASGPVIASSPVIYQLSPSMELNISISSNSNSTSNAFTDSASLIRNNTGSVELHDVQASEVSYLALNTGRTPQEVSDVVKAHQFAAQTAVAPELFYAAFKSGLNGDVADLLAQPKAVITEAVTAAAAQKVIPANTNVAAVVDSWQTASVSAMINEKPAVTNASLDDVMKIAIPDASKRVDIAKQYVNHDGDAASFWDNVQNVSTSEKQSLQTTLQCAALTGMQPQTTTAVVNKLQQAGSMAAMAETTKDGWVNFLGTLHDQTGGACIPVTISDNFSDKESQVNDYADKITDLLSTAFPTRNFTGTLQADSADTLSLGTAQSKVLSFLKTNTDFDFHVHPLLEVLNTNQNNFDTSAIANDPVAISELKTLQRLFNVAPDFDTVGALKQQGLDSAQKIAALTEEEFVTRVAGTSNGTMQLMGLTGTTSVVTATAATAIFRKASKVSLLANEVMAKMHPGLNLPAFVYNEFAPEQIADADLRTMFGSIEQCSCESCQSVFSPSAYLVDLLRFLEDNSQGASTDLQNAFKELKRRREDILHIDLTCKNANTAMPYVDLVNEILEKTILLRDSSITGIPDSYQTSGTAQAVAAYPEHTYKSGTVYNQYTDFTKAYDKLRAAKYPFSLPFNMPLKESKVYLEHMGIEFADLFREVHMLHPQTCNDAVTEYRYAAALLDISVEEADVITTTVASNADLYKYYGFPAATISVVDPADSQLLITGNWADKMSTRIDLFLQQTGLTYVELLQMLGTNFINPLAAVSIVSTDPSAPDTCDLSKLSIQGIYNSAAPTNTNWTYFQKIYRFIRLLRKTNLDIPSLDKLLTALSVTTLSSTDLVQVAAAISLSDKFFIPAPVITTLWYNVDTQDYINYESAQREPIPSAYASLFLNKSIANPVDPAFELTNLLAGTGSLAAHKDMIGAALKVSSAELDLLLDPANGFVAAATPDALSLANLSALLRHTLLAKAIQLKVADYIRFLNLVAPVKPFGTGASVAATTQAIFTFLELADKLKRSGFSLDELEYILLQKDNTSKPIGIREENVTNALITIRKELAKTQLATASLLPADQQNAYENLVIQEISKVVLVDPQIVSLLLTQQLSGVAGAFAIADFLTADIFKTEDVLATTAAHFPVAYTTIQRVYKLAYICNRLKLDAPTLDYCTGHTIGSPNAAAFGFTDLLALPSATIAQGQLALFLNLVDIIIARDTLPYSDTNIFDVLNEGVAPANEIAWVTKLQLRTGWEDADTMVGMGMLNASFNTDLKTGALLLKLNDLVATINLTGIKAADLAAVVDPAITAQTSAMVLKSAKAKHSEDAWLDIAKPLRDGIREQQRAALVSYLVAAPDPANGQRWRNSDELFEYLLIDVEMKPIMMTSRIKQAINSIQLFIERIILQLEFSKLDKTNPLITLKQSAIDQWAEWRKIYRVWEANRKIFLYPENWIEPELRDDKTNLFKELETQLMQAEVTADAVEEAMQTYVEKLDEVARLEIVGSYFEPYVDQVVSGDDASQGIIHLLGRSFDTPKKYFYRKCDMGEWTAWEKVDVEIKSDKAIPLIWNNRLYIFWLTFVQGANNGDVKMPATGDSIQDNSTRYIEYHLNWSEFKKGKWVKPSQADNYITKNDGHPEWIPGSLMLYPYKVDDSLMLVVADANMEQDSNNQYTGNLNMTYSNLSGVFEFQGPNSQPVAYDNTERNLSDLCLFAPNGSLFQGSPLNMKFGKDLTIMNRKSWLPGMNVSFDKKLKYDTFYAPGGTPARLGKAVILDNNPYNGYMLTPPANMSHDPLASYFFYEDAARTFYAERYEERINLVATLTQATSVSLASVTGTFQAVYAPTTTVGTQFTMLTPATSLSANTGLLSSVQQSATQAVISGNNANFFSSNIQSINSLQPVAAAKSSGAVVAVQNVPALNLSNSNVLTLSTNNSGTQLATATFTGPVMSKLGYMTRFRFRPHYHAHVRDFAKALNTKGLKGFLTLEMQSFADTINFAGNYSPNTALFASADMYPKDVVDFEYGGAYATYNWELFFHLPLLIAQRLSDNQQFEDAQKWFHYIFDPTCNRQTNKQRFWQFKPFYDEAGRTIQTLPDLMAHINSFTDQVDKWEANPFKPHVIARMRILAYMKCVVMKYIDNLVGWADQLFKQDTIEEINQATQLYVLAAKILGEKPQRVPARTKTDPKNYSELVATGTLDAFSNALVDAELLVNPSAMTTVSTSSVPVAGPVVKTLYFCLPKNDKLYGYWDTVSDRLFKIRNGMNIDGVVRQLPLYEPPIDPGMLVKAAAAGVDLSSALNDILSPVLPNYRFSYVLQKANEFCGDVRGLGSALLSALEKKDSEALSLLRSSHEQSVLLAMKSVKEQQLEDAKTALEALQKTRETTDARREYYATRPYLNPKEQQHLDSMQTSLALQNSENALKIIGGALSYLPNFKIGSPFSIGVTYGGDNLGRAFNIASGALGVMSVVNSTKGNVAQTMGGYDRRRDDWQFQADSAVKELAQIDQQILGAQIRIAIAEKELSNHQLQMDNAKEADDFMRNKYTNEDLYSWMIAQISTVYFQAYQMAYDLAKKAEKCYNFEVPAGSQSSVTGYIQFGYWDSLKKGLLSGEKLQYDLRRLEAAWMENNKRTYELTKHVSLAVIDPEQLVRLRTDGECEINLPEELFALDFPGHYNRRLKSVSVSIPCVAGPYTSVAATLTLTGSYTRKADSYTNPQVDTDKVVVSSIATSNAQNDAGMFELNFRDERYLPFEGAGAVSQWNLKLVNNKNLRQFDYDTISDVILHVKYTAQKATTVSFETDTITHLTTVLAAGDNNAAGSNYEMKLPRVFSLKQDFSGEWYKYKSGASAMSITVTKDMFPVFTNGHPVNLSGGFIKLKTKSGLTTAVSITGLQNGTLTLTHGTNTTWDTEYAASFTPSFSIGTAFNITVAATGIAHPLEDAVEDITLVLFYQVPQTP